MIEERAASRGIPGTRGIRGIVPRRVSWFDLARRTILTGCAVVCLGLLGSLQPGLYRGVRLTWDHLTTTARVVEIGERGGSNAHGIWADLEFTTPSGPVQARLFPGDDGLLPGQEIAIDYLPSHPRTVREAGRFWSNEMLAAAFEFGFLIALAATGWMWWTTAHRAGTPPPAPRSPGRGGRRRPRGRR